MISHIAFGSIENEKARGKKAPKKANKSLKGSSKSRDSADDDDSEGDRDDANSDLIKRYYRALYSQLLADQVNTLVRM